MYQTMIRQGGHVSGFVIPESATSLEGVADMDSKRGACQRTIGEDEAANDT